MSDNNDIAQFHADLSAQMGEFYADPLGFVTFAFPWGIEGGPLEGRELDTWQREYLIWVGEQVKERNFDGINAVLPIRKCTASGHGIGKSALVAMIVLWIMCTRPGCKIVVTANTAEQLKGKTWAEIVKWLKRCIAADWFEYTASKGNLRLWHKGDSENWYASGQTCKEENSESFAGQHSDKSSSVYIFDEASAVPDAIWEVAEGGLTDGQPMFFAFGNPTRSYGVFHRNCFGKGRDLWNGNNINSMDCAIPNKELFKQQIEEWGEDSDFARKRIYGLPPRSADDQYISHQIVLDAQGREVKVLDYEQVVLGIDVSRGGKDSTVLWFRKGNDAFSVPPIIIQGEKARDDDYLPMKVAEIVMDGWHGFKPTVINVDGTGIGGPITTLIRKKLGNLIDELGIQINEINFAAIPPADHCANYRAYIWWKMKSWLKFGSIPKNDDVLEQDLIGPEAGERKSDGKLLIESKEDMATRGLASPDRGDALALTLAVPVPLMTEKELTASWNDRVSSTGGDGVYARNRKHPFDRLNKK